MNFLLVSTLKFLIVPNKKEKLKKVLPMKSAVKRSLVMLFTLVIHTAPTVGLLFIVYCLFFIRT
jgi:hypothetical protein